MKHSVNNFDDIKAIAKACGKKVMVVPSGEDKTSLMASYKAVTGGFVEAVLTGNSEKIHNLCSELDINPSLFRIIESGSFEESAKIAVEMAKSGEANLILKGSLPTKTLLKTILSSKEDLMTGKLLSDIIFVEDPSCDRKRIIGITDGGINILPNLEDKKEIAKNAVFAFHKLGFETPMVAVLAAVESVNPSMPATIDAGELKKMNQNGLIKDCIIDGPLALDLAISAEAAEKKGVKSEVAGKANIFLVPNIESGNILGKSFTYFSKVPVGHVIIGAKVPILIPSRNESDEDKLNSIALGVIFA